MGDDDADLDAAGEAIRALDEDATASGAGSSSSSSSANPSPGSLGLDEYEGSGIAEIVNSGGDMMSELAAGETGLAEKCKWGESWAMLADEKGWSIEDIPAEVVVLATTGAFGAATAKVAYDKKQQAAEAARDDDEAGEDGVDNPFVPDEAFEDAEGGEG